MPHPRQRIVALLTDFGKRDWYVATLKAVILSRAPDVHLVDVTHEVPPQDIIAGAFALAAASPWFPPGTIFVAVVDPEVGSRRALLAAQADGRHYLGPDNGILALCLQRARRRQIVQLTARRYWLHAISQTFHGRDILAPVAAHLARGGSLKPLGPPRTQFRTLRLPPVRRVGRRLHGHIVYIDVFGNLMTNFLATCWKVAPGEGRAVLQYHRRRVPVVSSYADSQPHQVVAVINSLNLVELAVNNGSAARILHARRGDPIMLLRDPP